MVTALKISLLVVRKIRQARYSFRLRKELSDRPISHCLKKIKDRKIREAYFSTQMGMATLISTCAVVGVNSRMHQQRSLTGYISMMAKEISVNLLRYCRR